MKFTCEYCNYKTNRRSDFRDHLKTKKHKKRDPGGITEKKYPEKPKEDPIIKKNKSILLARITNNLHGDKKDKLESRRRSVENKDEWVNPAWVYEQYDRQNGLCAECNQPLINIREEEEHISCRLSTSVNRIDNSVGHIKENCNLTHSWCNCERERPNSSCYLFNCGTDKKTKKCKYGCVEKKKNIFEKINHPYCNNIQTNEVIMKAILGKWREMRLVQWSSLEGCCGMAGEYKKSPKVLKWREKREEREKAREMENIKNSKRLKCIHCGVVLPNKKMEKHIKIFHSI